PGCAAELLEQRRCLLERGARLQLFLAAAQHLSLREQRTRALERHRAALVVDERTLEQRFGQLQLAVRREDQCTAARAHGKAPWNLRACGARLELRDQRSGALEVCRAESAFNRVAVESPYRRLSKPRLCECLDRRGQMGRGGPRVAGRELGETERALPQHA